MGRSLRDSSGCLPGCDWQRTCNCPPLSEEELEERALAARGRNVGHAARGFVGAFITAGACWVLYVFWLGLRSFFGW